MVNRRIGQKSMALEEIEQRRRVQLSPVDELQQIVRPGEKLPGGRSANYRTVGREIAELFGHQNKDDQDNAIKRMKPGSKLRKALEVLLTKVQSGRASIPSDPKHRKLLAQELKSDNPDWDRVKRLTPPHSQRPFLTRFALDLIKHLGIAPEKIRLSCSRVRTSMGAGDIAITGEESGSTNDALDLLLNLAEDLADIADQK